jgi:VanZ family protein
MWKFLKANKITTIWSLVIIALCAFPGDNMPSLDFTVLFSFDKIAHTFSFGILSLVCTVGLAKYLHFSYMRKHSLTWAICYSLFLGGAIELAQAYIIPGRYGDIMDFIADTIGVFSGAGLFLVIYSRKPLQT